MLVAVVVEIAVAAAVGERKWDLGIVGMIEQALHSQTSKVNPSKNCWRLGKL